jgi:hypothetical protein
MQELSKARKVNEIWLTGWGCRLERLEYFRVVENQDFTEYNAVYEVTRPEYVRDALARAERIKGIFYLPREAKFLIARRHLLDAGWQSILRSETVVGYIAESGHRSDPLISLEAVEQRSLDSWVQLYHENYGMSDKQLKPNRRRWELAFSSEPAIHFYFVIVNGKTAGTVQLVAPRNEFCGIYSLTVRNHNNGLPILRAIARKLMSESIHLGSKWVCYERLRRIRRDPLTHEQIAHSLEWCGVEWRTLSREIGYSRATRRRGGAEG